MATEKRGRTRDEVTELIRHAKAIQAEAMDMIRFIREDELELLRASLKKMDYHMGKIDLYIRKRENQKGGE